MQVPSGYSTTCGDVRYLPPLLSLTQQGQAVGGTAGHAPHCELPRLVHGSGMRSVHRLTCSLLAVPFL